MKNEIVKEKEREMEGLRERAKEKDTVVMNRSM